MIYSRPSRPARPVHIDIVCQAAGLTTAAYSFGYVAHWSGGDPANIKATAERVVTTARNLLEACGTLQTEAGPLPGAVAA